ncbi:MAG: peptidylprolyl isomerase [Bacteroidota bacterium]
MKKSIYLLLLTVFFVSCKDNKDYLVNIKTDYGNMLVLLYEETPLHKKNFLELAKSGSYDSTIFHRVIEDFMIQGGNVAEKTGVPEKEEDRIPAEIVDGYYHTKGSLAAARQGDNVNPEKKSSSTQFYIVDGKPWDALATDINRLYQEMTNCLQDTSNAELIESYKEVYAKRDNQVIMDFLLKNKSLVEEIRGVDLTIDPGTKNNNAYKELGGSPFLDGEYTVFGRVVEGMEIIDKIAAVKTQRPDRPIDPVYMSMELVEMKKKEITEKYDYSYE